MKTLYSIFATLLLMTSCSSPTGENLSFDEVDTSGNGAISSSEFEAAGLDMELEDVDTNDDGVLTRGEYALAVGEEVD